MRDWLVDDAGDEASAEKLVRAFVMDGEALPSCSLMEPSSSGSIRGPSKASRENAPKSVQGEYAVAEEAVAVVGAACGRL